jgi:hypothetical protein
MRVIAPKEKLIRRYLLGDLDEGQRQRFEERFLTDYRFRKRVLLVEDELFDDYVLGALSSDERQKFDERLLATPEQVKKLETVRMFKDYVMRKGAVGNVSYSSLRRPSFVRRWLNILLYKRSLIYLPATVVALIILIGLIALIVVQRRSKPAQYAQSARGAIEEQLAYLNDPQNIGNEPPNQRAPLPSSILNVTLAPILIRGEKQTSAVTIPPDKEIVQFRLVLMEGEHQSFDAVMQTLESSTLFTVHRLQAVTEDGGKVVVLKIPVRLLPDGDYLLKLRSTSRDGQVNDIAEYYFRVLSAGRGNG